ncbi:MAG: hypothetical protein AAGL89_03980 [Pseudomonadota bacterium]
METLPLVWLLPIATLVLFVVFALYSRKKTQDLENKRTQDKSVLATDGPGPDPIGPDK